MAVGVRMCRCVWLIAADECRCCGRVAGGALTWCESERESGTFESAYERERVGCVTEVKLKCVLVSEAVCSVC